MKTSELFRKTLKDYLDKLGHGAQAKLADDIGMDRRHLNAFLNGRRTISESKREEISETLGYSYTDFLLLGKEEYDEGEYKFIPGTLRVTICIIEDFLDKFKHEISVKLSPRIKAKIIMNLYDCIFSSMERMAIISSGVPHIFNESRLIKAIEACDEEDNIRIKAELITCGYADPKNLKHYAAAVNQQSEKDEDE